MAKVIDHSLLINNVVEMLRHEKEWQERYARYARDIKENAEFINTIKEKFYQWTPLYVYLNFTNATAGKNKVIFELRYLGQTVAKLMGSPEKRILSTAGFDEKNARDFACADDHILRNEPWNGGKASAFRRYFRNRPAIRSKTERNKKNEEHRLESLFLTEFEKSDKEGKAISYIQSVKFADMQVRVPMPTPISASNLGKIKYSFQYGGGIDILARTGKNGSSTSLCVIELKDQYELPNRVISQALAYTVFIRELLRSQSKADWWDLFGFTSAVDKPLVLYAACLMPDDENADTSFNGAKYELDGDTIQLHYIYFKEEKGEIRITRTSLPYVQIREMLG